MGVSGWKKLLTSRKELFVLLKVFKQGSRKYFRLDCALSGRDDRAGSQAWPDFDRIQDQHHLTCNDPWATGYTGWNKFFKICDLYDQIFFQGADATAVGSMLFTRGVSGTRVVTGKDNKIIGKSCHCSFFPNMIFISRWCSVWGLGCPHCQLQQGLPHCCCCHRGHHRWCQALRQEGGQGALQAGWGWGEQGGPLQEDQGVDDVGGKDT